MSIVQPGDVLEVYVLEDEAFNGRYQVRSGGHVIFPKVGRIQVAGKSLGEAEASIKAAFETNQLKVATVIVERQGSGPKAANAISVYVHGAVEGIGRKSIPYIAGQPPTLYQAILESGGFSKWADQSRVVITREGAGSGGRIQVDIAAVIKGRAADVPLVERDIIFVPEKRFGF